MTVYVDDAMIVATVGRLTSRWSHLIADDQAELHAFAARFGVRLAWFQDPTRTGKPRARSWATGYVRMRQRPVMDQLTATAGLAHQPSHHLQPLECPGAWAGALAFPGNSLFNRSSWFSRSNSRNRALSDIDNGGSSPACATRYFATQLPNVVSFTPISRATSAIGCDDSMTSFTASSLNSGEYVVRRSGTFHPLHSSRPYKGRCPNLGDRPGAPTRSTSTSPEADSHDASAAPAAASPNTAAYGNNTRSRDNEGGNR